MLKHLTLIAALAAPLPAAAQGSFTLTLSPRTAQQSDALRLGLHLFALHNGIRSGDIRQRGQNNIAALRQSGHGNLGIIRQDGSDHNANLSQTGPNNSFGIFQSGRSTNAEIHQTGNGVGLMFLHGW